MPEKKFNLIPGPAEVKATSKALVDPREQLPLLWLPTSDLSKGDVLKNIKLLLSAYLMKSGVKSWEDFVAILALHSGLNMRETRAVINACARPDIQEVWRKVIEANSRMRNPRFGLRKLEFKLKYKLLQQAKSLAEGTDRKDKAPLIQINLNGS